MTDSKQPPAGNSARVLFSLLVLVVSLALIYGGVKLAALGGSSYYLIAGLAYLLLAVLFFLRKRIGISLSVATIPGNCASGHFMKWVSSAIGNCCHVWSSRPLS
jgi:quinate dehydrogenase (quinone)